MFAKSLVNDNSELVPVFDKWDGRYDLIGEHDDSYFSHLQQMPLQVRLLRLISMVALKQRKP